MPDFMRDGDSEKCSCLDMFWRGGDTLDGALDRTFETKKGNSSQSLEQIPAWRLVISILIIIWS